MLAVAMMIKNEEDSITTTLQSVRGLAKQLIIYDTGSEDRTLERVDQFRLLFSGNVHIFRGSFADFSSSRNALLQHVDNVCTCDYVLLLDAGDELRNGDELETLLPRLKERGVLVRQIWEEHDGHIQYYNLRCIKPRTGWRYEGKIHECLLNEDEDPSKILRLPDSIFLYQNRKKDTRSLARFSKDIQILLYEPETSRNLFYLALTYHRLGQIDNACIYSQKRLVLGGWDEEIFHCYMILGQKDPQKYLDAYRTLPRVEPLIKLASHYLQNNDKETAKKYVELACSLRFPREAVLFVNLDDYNWRRYFLLQNVK